MPNRRARQVFYRKNNSSFCLHFVFTDMQDVGIKFPTSRATGGWIHAPLTGQFGSHMIQFPPESLVNGKHFVRAATRRRTGPGGA